MSPHREYPAVLLLCCRHKQKVTTTEDDELALVMLGKLSQKLTCAHCGCARTLELVRVGLKTMIRDKTEN